MQAGPGVWIPQGTCSEQCIVGELAHSVALPDLSPGPLASQLSHYLSSLCTASFDINGSSPEDICLMCHQYSVVFIQGVAFIHLLLTRGKDGLLERSSKCNILLTVKVQNAQTCCSPTATNALISRLLVVARCVCGRLLQQRPRQSISPGERPNQYVLKPCPSDLHYTEGITLCGYLFLSKSQSSPG